jgi:hypothetical protein
MSHIVRTVHVSPSETVEVVWHVGNEPPFHQRFTCPPQEVREAARKKEGEGGPDQGEAGAVSSS